jgi:hypothetical protein
MEGEHDPAVVIRRLLDQDVPAVDKRAMRAALCRLRAHMRVDQSSRGTIAPTRTSPDRDARRREGGGS